MGTSVCAESSRTVASGLAALAARTFILFLLLRNFLPAFDLFNLIAPLSCPYNSPNA